jgi:hypothetical protein
MEKRIFPSLRVSLAANIATRVADQIDTVPKGSSIKDHFKVLQKRVARQKAASSSERLKEASSPLSSPLPDGHGLAPLQSPSVSVGTHSTQSASPDVQFEAVGRFRDAMSKAQFEELRFSPVGFSAQDDSIAWRHSPHMEGCSLTSDEHLRLDKFDALAVYSSKSEEEGPHNSTKRTQRIECKALASAGRRVDVQSGARV